MKKRVLSFVLAMILIVALLPTAAFASTNGKTADDAINWVRSQNGKTVGSGECVALIYAYYSFLGQTSPGGDGKDYWTNALPAGWTRIPNAQPQKGDILVYGGNTANPAGHVAIYEADYSTWHQNFAGARYVTQVTQYRYNGFTNPYLGVIRPDFSSGSSTPTFANIGTNVLCYLIRTDGWKHIGTNYDSSNKSNVTIGAANTGDPEQVWKFICRRLRPAGEGQDRCAQNAAGITLPVVHCGCRRHVCAGCEGFRFLRVMARARLHRQLSDSRYTNGAVFLLVGKQSADL